MNTNVQMVENESYIFIAASTRPVQRTGYTYYYNINWNYGLLPQTWEDPSFANPEVDGAFGDNDPCKLDVVEIGEKRGNVGELMKIKPLGCLAMIDEGELDWKIIAISLDDPKAALFNDVEKHFPVCYFFN
ncbi:putative inorganic diphosphatase [Helianthus anomalus]